MASDRSWPMLDRVGLKRHGASMVGPLVLALIIGGAVMGALGWFLPTAEPAVSKAVGHWLSQRAMARTGFRGGDARLGGLEEILNSDEVVMRVEGDPVDHLRGQVYVHYQASHWASPTHETTDTVVEDDALVLSRAPTVGRVLIETSGAIEDYLFAPLNAARLTPAPTDTRVDRYGVIRARPDGLWAGRRYTLDLAAPDVVRTAMPPGAQSRRLPKGLAKRLTPIADAWIGDASSPRAIADRLMVHLMRFRYTLKPPPVPRGHDPVLHFLTEGHAGHCEYYASALVLLARTRGIPGRWVSGYRVVERHPAGYQVVRQRDAHAWAELWIDGRWQTYDPTPPGALASAADRAVGPLSALLDRARRWAAGRWRDLWDLTLGHMLTGAAVIGLLLALWVILRRRREASALAQPTSIFGPLMALEHHLADRTGLVRAASEPLGRFAQRLELQGHTEAAALVRACVRLRYGGAGDEPAVAAQITAFLRPRSQ